MNTHAMLKRISLLIAICIIATGCYRPRLITRAGIPPKYNIISASNTGNTRQSIPDSTATLSLTDSIDSYVGISFELTGGDATGYSVLCYFTDLPPGITVEKDSATAYLNGTAGFKFSAATTPGTYPAKIAIVTPDKGLQVYPVAFKVLPVPDCAQGLEGEYTGSDPCGHLAYGQFWYTYTATVTTVPGHPHMIKITNFHGLGDSIEVFATISCGYSFDIPVQTVHGYTFMSRGKGNWEYGLRSYGDTTVYMGDTTTCFTQLTRKQ